jgi:hypothetical protein
MTSFTSKRVQKKEETKDEDPHPSRKAGHLCTLAKERIRISIFPNTAIGGQSTCNTLLFMLADFIMGSKV